MQLNREILQERGVRALTDNWLLQHVAEIVTCSKDPRVAASVLALRNAETLEVHTVPLGALQIASLCSLLELVVLAGHVYVMQGWTDAWRGRASSLDLLLDAGVIRELDPDADAVSQAHEDYNRQFCEFPAIQREHLAATDAWVRGEPVFPGQLINGTAAYLALARTTGYAYWPHPARAIMLAGTLYDYRRRPNPLFSKLDEVVRTTRIKYCQAIGTHYKLAQLAYSVPSMAIACLFGAQDASGAIQAAVQLRESADVRALRTLLNRASAETIEASTGLEEAAKVLDDAVARVEKELGIRKAEHSEVALEWNLLEGGVSVTGPLKLIRQIAESVVAPKHTAILSRLVRTGRLSAEDLVHRALGIRDRSIIDGLRMLNALQAPPDEWAS